MGSNPAIPTMQFGDVVRRRRMVRHYTGKGIDPEKLDRIIDAALKAPSAGFSQGQSFVVVTDAAMRDAVAAIVDEPEYVAQGFDPWISRAGALVVCCTSAQVYMDRYSLADKLGPDGSQIEWPVPFWWVDAGCSLMLLLLAATDEGVASGFLGLSHGNLVRLRELFGIPAEVSPVGIVTLGERAPDRKSGSLKRGWRPREQVVHKDRWRGGVPPVTW
ncbi:MAG TPA: nitroreductase family protein [Actinomycetota bacterium]|nr:nitroreductase family protein [Actinomycetota bacterium]